MIRSFADKTTAAVFTGRFAKDFPAVLAARARMKLAKINAASTIEYLRLLPSNHVEALKGNRAGQWSIRINGQWRICFRFESGDAYNVEIVDYY